MVLIITQQCIKFHFIIFLDGYEILCLASQKDFECHLLINISLFLYFFVKAINFIFDVPINMIFFLTDFYCF